MKRREFHLKVKNGKNRSSILENRFKMEKRQKQRRDQKRKKDRREEVRERGSQKVERRERRREERRERKEERKQEKIEEKKGRRERKRKGSQTERRKGPTSLQEGTVKSFIDLCFIDSPPQKSLPTNERCLESTYLAEESEEEKE